MYDSSVWTALSDDTTNLASSALRITGKYSLEFDKANGSANGTIAGASRAVKLNLDESSMQVHDKIQWSLYLSALTNVASCYVKIGTDASNNMQWTIADTALNTGWTVCTGVVGEPSAVNGTGWDPTNITYMEVGVVFDLETNTLADIKVDAIAVVPSRYTEDNSSTCIDSIARVDSGRFQATITSADASSATGVKAKTADKKIYILSLLCSTDTELNVQFQDDTGTPVVLIENIYLAANGGFVMNFPPEAPLVVDTNKDFDVIASSAGNITVSITGYVA